MTPSGILTVKWQKRLKHGMCKVAVRKNSSWDLNKAAVCWHTTRNSTVSYTHLDVYKRQVIEWAYKKTGKAVVVLVDEYDSPMLDTNSDVALPGELRGIMRDFFSPLKGCLLYTSRCV